MCSHEQWAEIYERIAELVREHRTTLVFVNTRKMAERIAARSPSCWATTRWLPPRQPVARAASRRRAAAQGRRLRALVATASLELGIDIGDVDLVIQVGATRSIATFLQRVGRAGHALRMPKGRLFPLTLDELVEAAALLRGVGRGVLDRTPPLRPPSTSWPSRWWRPACRGVARGRPVRAGPPRLAVPRSHARRLRRGGRACTRTGAGPSCIATAWTAACWPRSARGSPRSSPAAPSPTPPTTKCVIEPDGTLVGTVNEDFAIESNGGDISSSATPRGGSCAWSPESCASPTPRASRRRFRSGSARRPGARASWPPRSPKLREEWRPSPVEYLAPPAARPCPTAAAPPDRRLRGGRAQGRSAPCRPRSAWSSSASSTRAAACSSWCTRPSARHQPRLGPRVAQALLRRLRLRAAGRGQRRGDRLVAGPAAQLPAGRGVRLSEAATAREMLVQALLDAPMFETRWRWNASGRCCWSACATARGAGRRSCACAPTTCWRERSRRRWRAGNACPAVRSKSRWIIRSCARRSRTACTKRWTWTDSSRCWRRCRTGASSARGRHRRAVRLRARHPLVPAVHVPRRCSARRAAHPSRDGAAHAGRANRRRARRARPEAIARVREEAWPQPAARKRCTKRCFGWAT